MQGKVEARKRRGGVPAAVFGAMLAGGALGTAALADEPVNLEAQAALGRGDAQNALSLLRAAREAGNYDNQTLFLLAMACKQAGDLSCSERYFRELLSAEPEAGRVKLELAEVYALQRRFNEAQALVEEVERTSPPEDVAANIAHFSGEIRANTHGRWAGYVGAGLFHDSNATQGPANENIEIFGLPFTLSRDATSQADQGLELFGGVAHEINLGSARLVSRLDVSGTEYMRTTNSDNFWASASTGPTWGGATWALAVPYAVAVAKVGSDMRWSTFTHGPTPSLTYRASDDLTLRAGLGLQRRHHGEDVKRDSTLYSATLGATYSLGGDAYASLSGWAVKENSGLETYSNLARGVSLGYTAALAEDWSFNLSPSFRHIDFNGTEIAFGMSRRDTQAGIAAGVTHYLRDVSSEIALSVSHARNASTIAAYDYRRTQVSTSFIHHF